MHTFDKKECYSDEHGFRNTQVTNDTIFYIVKESSHSTIHKELDWSKHWRRQEDVRTHKLIVLFHLQIDRHDHVNLFLIQDWWKFLGEEQQ